MKKCKQLKSLFLMAILMMVVGSVYAQQPPPPPPPPHGPKHMKSEDHLGRAFFPPEMIMRHQSELKLSENQRKFIIGAVQEAQSNFTDWKWTLEAEMEKMNALTNSEKVDEAKVLAQLDKVLALEKQIKIQQLKMMIGIKNQLTSEQQKKLEEIKATFVPKREGPPRPERK